MTKNKIYFFVSLIGILFINGCTVKVFDAGDFAIPANNNQNTIGTVIDSNPQSTNSQQNQQAQIQNVGAFFQAFAGVVQNIEANKKSRRGNSDNSITPQSQNTSYNNELETLLSSIQSVKPNKSKWLFVIGIEKYEFTDNISYASRSAEMFSKVAMKKLGVPKENSYVLINNDATQAKIKTAIQKLLNRVKNGDEIYFYYNGHGIPVAKENFEPYMLASDTEPDYIDNEKFFALNNIYGLLSNSKASKVVALVDSCFSGATDGKSVLKGVAATKMKPKLVNFDKEKMVVITAGKGYQYSNGYDKKGYRMFSYFTMKSILESDTQNINISDIYKQIKNETYDASLQEYGDLRAQEPQIEGNENLKL